jgi:hypothetical protein
MAVVTTTTYLYVDTNLIQHFVQGSELVDRGPWSSSAFYNPNEVVQIGVDQYVCLVANSNAPPTGIVDENWSTLVIVEEASGSVATAGSDYYARYTADLALQTAWTGTFIGSAAYNYAEAAYNIAIIGTNIPSGFSVGTDAYHLAQSGTNIGWAAYLLAQIGTNTGTAALSAAATAQSTANSAFSIAVIGSNAATSAQSTADSAFDIAVAGTTAAALCVLRAGDTMTGTLTTPNVFYTHGTSSNAGTVLVDFNSEAIKTVFMTAATVFDGTNYLPAHAVTYRCFVSGTAAEVPVTFNSNFVILNEIPTGFIANKITVVSFTSFGNTASDVVVAYALQA